MIKSVDINMGCNYFKKSKKQRIRITRSGTYEYLQSSIEHELRIDHLMELSSYKEIYHFITLSLDKAKAKLRDLVTKMDLNCDKEIDKQEIKTWLVKSIKQFLEEAQQELKRADKNHDGKITWNEYIADVYGLNNAADANGDGMLEGDEWLMFSHEEEYPVIHSYMLKQFLSDIDTDKDGVINFREYIAADGNRAILSFQESNKSEDLKREAFYVFDQDSNGKLCSKEIISWKAPNSEKKAEIEIEGVKIKP